MNQRLLLPTSLAALWLFAGAAAPPADAPTGAPFENWRFNARERSAQGLKLLASEPNAAAEAFATAARLEPGNARAQANAGAGWMIAGDPQRGIEALAQAARLVDQPNADDTLVAETQYQLGTAKLAADDLEGSIEALRESLRRDPAAEDAKHNLELALRRKQKQDEERQQQQQPDQEQPPTKPQDQQTKPQNQQPQDQQPQDQQPSPQPGEQPQAPEQRPGDFKDWKPQPGMTQAQAEALLEAVENRERQQRRDEAKKRALRRSREEKDW